MVQELKLIATSDISPNPYQPRYQFKQEELADLAQSIKENGLIQPILVRQSPVFGYELIAGERRLRASKLAGLTEIPAIIKDISDLESKQLAIIENLQRSDLNPVEEAKAFRKLLEQEQLSHEELAQVMGKSRPYITNSLRLLKLTSLALEGLETGQISAGHARCLLSLKNEEAQEAFYQKILDQDLSVRQLEEAIKPKGKKTSRAKKDSFIAHQEKELSQSLGLPVKLNLNKSHQGKLTIQVDNLEDLNRLINKLK